MGQIHEQRQDGCVDDAAGDRAGGGESELEEVVFPQPAAEHERDVEAGHGRAPQQDGAAPAETVRKRAARDGRQGRDRAPHRRERGDLLLGEMKLAGE